MAKQFLFLGDSLVEFFDWQQHFTDSEVYNFGVAGETAEGLLSRLPGIIARFQAPSLVMIMTGTNNIAMEDYGFLFTYEKIIALLQKNYAHTAIFVTSLLPMDLFFLGDAVPRVNKRLRDIAGKMNIFYLDLYPLFLGNDAKPVKKYYEPDGVHLSRKGYDVWAGALEAAVFPAKD